LLGMGGGLAGVRKMSKKCHVVEMAPYDFDEIEC